MENNTVLNNAFEKINMTACIIFLSIVTIFIFTKHNFDWKTFLWFIGSCIYYRAIYEVYSSYVVKNNDGAIWLLIIAGMVTGIIGGVMIALLWDVIRFFLKLVLKPKEQTHIKFFITKALNDIALH